jgi:hypothetical protein
MSVMPARVHHALAAQAELDPALLLDRQCIDVCAKREGAPRSSAVQPGNDARRGRALDLQATERGERLADEASRLMLVEGKLGMGVQVPSPSNRVGRDSVDAHRCDPGLHFMWETAPVSP